MKTAEERGREFLAFVGENVSRLKRNLLKNISYDPEYFEDVFSYTILRVYNSILKRGLDIKDYEQYFFQASRLNYIKIKGRSESQRNRQTALSDAYEVTGDDRMSSLPAIEDLQEELIPLFGASATDLFIRFIRAKIEDRTNYRDFAAREGLSESYVAGVCGKIRKYLRN